FFDLAGDLVEQAGSMPFGLVFFSQGIALTFYGDAMQQFWPRYITQISEHAYQVFYIMPVYRPEVAEFQRFEQIGIFKQCAFNAFFELLGKFECIRSNG